MILRRTGRAGQQDDKVLPVCAYLRQLRYGLRGKSSLLGARFRSQQRDIRLHHHFLGGSSYGQLNIDWLDTYRQGDRATHIGPETIFCEGKKVTIRHDRTRVIQTCSIAGKVAGNTLVNVFDLYTDSRNHCSRRIRNRTANVT